MGLLDTILSTIDAKKRSAKRGIMDMLDNPQQWAGMQANRIQEDRYGGAENAQAMKQYLSKQPYDQKALTAANDALRNAAINESLGAIFIGKGAKTWDKMKEADAMSRLAKGEDAATVWKETGVGVAPWDKIARGEISDHSAEYRPGKVIGQMRESAIKNIDELAHAKTLRSIMDTNNVKIGEAKDIFRKEFGREPIETSGSLAKFTDANELQSLLDRASTRVPSRDDWTSYQRDVMAHDPLYSAYPNVENMEFSVKPNTIMGSAGGQFDGGVRIGTDSAYGLQSGKSLNIHELQHAIQSQEGFAKGGNPGMFNPKEAEKARDILSWRKEVEQWISKNWPNAKVDTEVLRNADQRLRDEYSALGAYDMVPPVDLRDTALSHTLKVGSKQRDDMAQMVKEYGLDQRVTAPSSTDMYKRLAGEAEARLAQYRMNLTPEARAALYPYDPAYFKQATGVDIDKLITRGLLDDGPAMSVAPKLTEFEQRHLTAQKNAALPVEQGGLGLPPNNTAMDRARAMGFDTPYAHFSRHGIDSNVLDSGKYAIAPFDAIGTHVGTESAALERFNNTVGYKVNNPSYANDELKGVTYPVMIKKGNQMLDESGNVLNELPISMRFSETADYGNIRDSNAKLREDVFGKYDSIPYINDVESAGNISYIVPPQNIRSRFAAFDPKRRHEADLLGYADPYLLGSMGAGGLLGMGGYSMMNDK